MKSYPRKKSPTILCGRGFLLLAIRSDSDSGFEHLQGLNQIRSNFMKKQLADLPIQPCLLDQFSSKDLVPDEPRQEFLRGEVVGLHRRTYMQ